MELVGQLGWGGTEGEGNERLHEVGEINIHTAGLYDTLAGRHHCRGDLFSKCSWA